MAHMALPSRPGRPSKSQGRLPRALWRAPHWLPEAAIWVVLATPANSDGSCSLLPPTQVRRAAGVAASSRTVADEADPDGPVRSLVMGQRRGGRLGEAVAAHQRKVKGAVLAGLGWAGLDSMTA